MWVLLFLFFFSIKADDSTLYSSSQYILIDNKAITLYETRYNPLHFMNKTFSLTLCYGELANCFSNPLFTPTLWVVKDYYDIISNINLAQTLLIPILVFVSDKDIPYYYLENYLTTLIFTIPSSEAKKLENLPPNTIVNVIYNVTINCTVASTAALICFVVFIVLYLLSTIGLANSIRIMVRV